MTTASKSAPLSVWRPIATDTFLVGAPHYPEHVDESYWQRDAERMAAAGLRAFEKIAAQWGLSIEEQLRLLGDPPRSTFYAWKKNPQAAKLSRDTLERLSYMLGIYKALQILLPDAAAADAWVRKSNDAPGFGGRSALDRMCAGSIADLHHVRRYLDAARGGGWS
jgi:hypothetical protein